MNGRCDSQIILEIRGPAPIAIASIDPNIETTPLKHKSTRGPPITNVRRPISIAAEIRS